ncbi:hypothetical protein TSUD_335210 [Trifolium subterraneum]|uniref:Importin subunit alpha n=1 Tax=Trifolium subterraneum TaxID=3900 RepID=A0A2Z6PGK2_TRISU|nr:hypothetical protein TSUD_335210 [Trifolium subterraneum]
MKTMTLLPNDKPNNEIESLTAMVAGVHSNDTSAQLEATKLFRTILSRDLNPPIEEVVQSGVVPRFVEFLAREDMPQLQFEAAWALANIACGTSENTKVVIDHGAVPLFVALLSSPSNDVRDKAVWALGNIAGDSPTYCDLVLGQGALVPLLALLKSEYTELSMLRNSTWTLSNFCKGKPQPAFELVRPALPVLQRLIFSDDPEVLTYACWALSYLTDGTNVEIQAIIEANVCHQLVQILKNPLPSVLIPALRTVGNIVTGSDMQTQTVFEAGLIAPLVSVLQNAQFEIHGVIEAAWAISNAISGGFHERSSMYLVNQGCIKPLCDLLVYPDPKIVTVCLEALENILNVGEAEKIMGNSGDSNLYAQMIVDSEGLEKIENLQNRDNFEIYERAVKLLETFWSEDELMLPSGDDDQSGFMASVPSAGLNFN